jgi:hypothetical protein
LQLFERLGNTMPQRILIFFILHRTSSPVFK